jgi:hypothetical protein
VVIQQTATDVNQVKVATQQAAVDISQVKVTTQQSAIDIDQVKVATQQSAIDIDQVKRLLSNLISADYGPLCILSGNQLRETVYKWLSPPDPSTNHNIACDTHHKKTASWFFQGSIFREWKSTGSLLWIHGKRLPRPLSNLTPSNAILYCSWLWQKRALVCVFLVVPIRDH